MLCIHTIFYGFRISKLMKGCARELLHILVFIHVYKFEYWFSKGCDRSSISRSDCESTWLREDEMDSEDEMLSQLLDNFEQGGSWATAKGEGRILCCMLRYIFVFHGQTVVFF